MFVTDKPFHPNLLLSAYLSERHLHVGRLWLYSQILDLDGNEQFVRIINILMACSNLFLLPTFDKSFFTFYGRNLQIFVIS